MEFCAIVTAMPDDDSALRVELETFGTTREAYKAVVAMAIEVSTSLRRTGVTIASVEIE